MRHQCVPNVAQRYLRCVLPWSNDFRIIRHQVLDNLQISYTRRAPRSSRRYVHVSINLRLACMRVHVFQRTACWSLLYPCVLTVYPRYPSNVITLVYHRQSPGPRYSQVTPEQLLPVANTTSGTAVSQPIYLCLNVDTRSPWQEALDSFPMECLRVIYL